MTGKDEAIRSASSIQDVVGRVDSAGIANMLSERCGAMQEEIDLDDGMATREHDTYPHQITDKNTRWPIHG